MVILMIACMVILMIAWACLSSGIDCLMGLLVEWACLPGGLAYSVALSFAGLAYLVGASV